MMLKTHLAITLFFVLLLLPSVHYKLIFAVFALLATYVPDIDSPNSKLGHKWYFRPVQFFVKHRGLVHSFSFLLIITFFMILFSPIIALPVFLGYSLHLLADSFTLEGIKPFYPWKRTSSWRISTGGTTETGILLFFAVANLFLVVSLVSNLF